MANRAILCIWIILGFAHFQAIPAKAKDADRHIIVKENSDYFGFDLKTEQNVSLDQCKTLCLGNPACKAFTYNMSAQFCFLKSDFGPLNGFSGAVAGRVATKGTGPDLGAPPELSFVPNYLIDEARKFRASLASSKSLSTNLGFAAVTSVARQNLAGGNTKVASDYLSAALKIDPQDLAVWLELSAVAHVHRTKSSSERRFYNNITTSAAISAYRLSRTKSTRAAALAHLARGLEAQRRYRPAITAYDRSLELNDVAAERTAFLELRRKHGFRVLNHTVDSDNLNPRICVQFSENLNKAASGYESFLSVNKAPPQAIDVRDRQICVEGLDHGKSYKVGLRQGLPSSIGENLLNNVDLDVYIRDRQPAARFTGNNFVLPLAARRGIPLVTVNTDKADLKLFRIGERALSQLFQGWQFLQQLNPSQAEYLTNDIGEPAWQGSVAIKPDLNREVVTSIPIDEALPNRKPGVYLLTAQPADRQPGTSEAAASQWFVISDIGLTTFSGNTDLQVFARSLASATPMAGVDVTLIARNNEVLGTGTTDADGQAKFDGGLLRGKGGLAPSVITAKRSAGDFVFLDVSNPGFDFSDRGVAGRAVPAGVDVYAWTERGIYRAGETVHVAALARDPSARAIDNLPLTFVFRRPDGVEERRLVDSGKSLGGYAVELPLTTNARHGTWRVQVYTDPKANPVADQRFLVEDFLPERIDFTVAAGQQSIAVGQPGTATVNGRYLYGAPASGLTLEGELVVRTKRDRKGFAGYQFGLSAKQETVSQRFPIEGMAPLDTDGTSTFSFLLDNIAATTRPLTADLVVRMREGSGRAVERKTAVAIKAPGVMIGVRPQFDGGQVAENSSAGFEVIAVDPGDGMTGLADVAWSIVKVERNYQWYRNGSSWRYESIDLEKKVSSGSFDIKAEKPSKISVPVDWGHYRLDIETATANGPATSIEFNAGWFVQAKSTETPDGLEIALDKSQYEAGDIARLKVSPRFAGEMLIAIGTDSIVETMSVAVPPEGATFDVPVGSDWGAGAYVLATLYRPGDAGTSRMPARAIGVKWLSVDPQARNLAVSLGADAQTRPHEPLKIPVMVSGLTAGQEAYVTVAAVDVGILNLTNYRSPDPVKRYFGQRKLGVEMRDIYGRLIDGSLGATGRLRTGGDSADNMSADGNPPTEKLVAFFSGPVRLDDNGQAEVTFDIPQFNGTVRIMATAWTADGVGAAEAETVIRDPIVVSASLPKFMAPGDQARLLIDIANTDAPAGQYAFDIETSDTLSLNRDQLASSIDLVAGQQTSLAVPISAQSAGEAWARIRLSRPDSVEVEHEISMNVRPGQLPVTRKMQVALAANGGSLMVDRTLFEDSQLDGAKISVSVGRASAFDVPSLILQLDRYPYGCAEQVTSKALPLLYSSDFSTGIPGLDQAVVRDRIQKAINTVLSYQSNSGGFSLWGTQADDLWLGAYVTEFLTRASEKGYDVPARPMKQALQSLQNVLAYRNDLASNDAAVAYALYVLARNRLASAGDLRYYADTQLQSFRTPIARAQLAAGMALYGDQQRAKRTFSSAFQLAKENAVSEGGQYHYGSRLRDASAMLALASEARPEPSDTAGMIELVSALHKADTYTSTQEQAWMLLAARAAKAADDTISLSVNGLPHSGALARRIEGGDLADSPLRVTNRHGEDLQATVTTIAVPAQPLAAGGEGFTIERTYYRLDGTQTSVSDVTQNERFVVVINVKQLNDLPSRLVVTDLLPAGFEIDNPRLIGSADLGNFNWLPETAVAHSEFRDDRFVTAFDRAKGGETQFTVAYTVRAVTPGRFTHPAASVEDMYRPQLSARTASGWMQVARP